MTRRRFALLAALLAAACAPAKEERGIDPQGKTFDRVAPAEAVTLIGTEPFWNLTIADGQGVWTTPDRQPGMALPLTRFAGNNGLGFTGTLDGKPLVATLTPGSCSDGMSDRRYPFVATIALGGETFEGCGYTTGQPFTGDAAP
jgi:uncharacterized membrane protein